MAFTTYLKELLGETKVLELIAACKAGKTIVVVGPQGPTGKTTLCSVLTKAGYRAIEVNTDPTIENNAFVVNLNHFIENQIPCFEDTISFDEMLENAERR